MPIIALDTFDFVGYTDSMTANTLIRRELLSDQGRAVLAAMPPPESFPGRTAFAREVCARFGFFDALGNPRESSCRAALRDLDAAGLVKLPPARRSPSVAPRPQMSSDPVPAACGVPKRAGAVAGLDVRPVAGREEARILSRLLHDEHPQGAVQHGGRQLRYLVASDHGWLGGFVFASPSSALAPRDRWIGWTAQARLEGLDRVVGMSRFLIRPQVRCRNLASKALGLCLSRLAADFRDCYGIVPTLCETFTGPGFSGACLAASGWIWVGESSGRGRRAAPGQRVDRKGIWMRPLRGDWREVLGAGAGRAPPPRPKAVLQPGEGLDMDRWAENEFGAAPFGGALVKRIVRSVTMQSKAPSKTFFSAACGDAAAVTGYYRMIERPEDGDFTPEAILSAHRERTLKRVRGASTALLIQDGTDLNFSTHGGCSGLGVISRNKGSAGTLGIHMHSTFAVNGDGVPLGVPRIEFDCPDGRADKVKPHEERKSARWLRGWRDASELAAAAPGTRVVSVMDREGDIAALFAERRARGGAELLVRAKHDRAFPDGDSLFERVRKAPADGEHEVRIDRASPRRAARGQKGFAGREARRARAELRWQALDVPVPKAERSRLGAEPMRLTAVHVREPEPPAGAEAVEWLLLTTLPVGDRRAAVEVLDLYSLRWRIEDWHRILKSGCDVEKTAHSTAGRIKRAVALNAVIAWRLAALTLLGRATPELPAENLFAGSEIAMLLDYARHMGFALPCQAEAGETPGLDDVSLGEAVLLVARLGGYLNRKNDGPPGHQVVWEGYARMTLGAQALERAVRIGEASAIHTLRAQLEND